MEKGEIQLFLCDWVVCVYMRKKNSLRFVAFLLILIMILPMTLTGCKGEKTSKGNKEDGIVLKVSENGMKGDGVTDDSAALDAVLDLAKMKGQNGEHVVIEFEKDKSYYFKDMYGENAIFELSRYKNLTLRGDNTTIIMDKSANLCRYVNVDFSENIAIEGLNFKFSQPW